MASPADSRVNAQFCDKVVVKGGPKQDKILDFDPNPTLFLRLPSETGNFQGYLMVDVDVASAVCF